MTGNAPPRRLRPLLGRQGAPALDIGLPGSHGQELTASGRKRQGSAGYQPQVSKANRFEGSNGKGQWGRSRTFYISSLSRSPSLGNHRTHFSNVRTNPQTLPTWRHFGNALQPGKRRPVLGPSFASRSTRGLPHRGQILRSGPCGAWSLGSGIVYGSNDSGLGGVERMIGRKGAMVGPESAAEHLGSEKVSTLESPKFQDSSFKAPRGTRTRTRTRANEPSQQPTVPLPIEYEYRPAD